MADCRHSVVYQIWPRSFQDSNGDGIGDINGIRSRLPYLKSLGIDLLWISPLYQSPNDDYGYDISDYYSINPEFGTIDDLKELIREAKLLGIGILMDLVANHTSTRHAWFRQALADPSSPCRGFYFFRHGSAGGPPNNWLSFFGESAWQKAEGDMYYLTTFAATQADLNWANPAVRKEIYKIMIYYMDLGIAGFRMDVINTIDKISGLPSKDPDKEGLQFPGDYIIDRPNVETYLKEMNQEVLTPRHAVSVGEGVLVTPESVRAYTRTDSRELDMMFQFELMTLGYGVLGRYDCRKLYHFTDRDFKAAVRKWQTAMQRDGSYLGNCLSNHDNIRQLDHFGSTKRWRAKSAKAVALFNFCLYGTPFIYQGEEIAMVDPHLTRKDWKDYECFHSSEAMTTILHIPPWIAEPVSSRMTRDNARTPVQWDGSANAGFTKAENPWMIVNPDYPEWNAARQEEDPGSVLNFYRACIRLRRTHEALCTGSWTEVLPEHPHVLAFLRRDEKETLLCMINLSAHRVSVKLPDCFAAEDLLSNDAPRDLKPRMVFSAWEAHLFRKIPSAL